MDSTATPIQVQTQIVVLASDGVTDAEELRRQALASFPLA